MKEEILKSWVDFAGQGSVLSFSEVPSAGVDQQRIATALNQFASQGFDSLMCKRFLTVPEFKKSDSTDYIQRFWWSRSMVIEALRSAIENKLNPQKTMFSLSHTSQACLVVGTEVKQGGVGVDLEFTQRPINVQLASRITDANEEISDLSPIEIWTIKEACFKAHLQNHQTVLTEYKISKVINQRGTVQFRAGLLEFNFQVNKFGPFTIAFAKTV